MIESIVKVMLPKLPWFFAEVKREELMSENMLNGEISSRPSRLAVGVYLYRYLTLDSEVNLGFVGGRSGILMHD